MGLIFKDGLLLFCGGKHAANITCCGPQQSCIEQLYAQFEGIAPTFLDEDHWTIDIDVEFQSCEPPEGFSSCSGKNGIYTDLTAVVSGAQSAANWSAARISEDCNSEGPYSCVEGSQTKGCMTGFISCQESDFPFNNLPPGLFALRTSLSFGATAEDTFPLPVQINTWYDLTVTPVAPAQLPFVPCLLESCKVRVRYIP
jgi:hypothetical protein